MHVSGFLKYAAVCLLVSVAATGYETYAQDYYKTTPVEVSKEKVRVNGVLYYSHIVRERQTLYSISKAYGVSIDDICDLNPAVKESGLKKNSVILIPIAGNGAKPDAKKASAAEQSSGNEVTAAGGNGAGQDTAGRQPSGAGSTDGTRTYADGNADGTRTHAAGNASGNAAEGGLGTGGNAASDSGRTSDAATGRTDGRKIHTVRWFETLESVAEKYGVTEEDIILANNLESRKLKSRQKLVIPTADEIAQLKKEAREAAERESARTDAYTSAVQSADGTASAKNGAKNRRENRADGRSGDVSEDRPGNDSRTGDVSGNRDGVWNWDGGRTEYGTGDRLAENRAKNRVKAALLLPFRSGDEKPSSSSFDFYCGALLAARDLGNSGLNIDLDVCDITDGGDPITRERLEDDDFIIGPVTPSDIRKIVGIAGTDKPLISPLDPKAACLAAEFPNLIQVPTPHDLQYADLVQWMADETREGDRTILIKEKGAEESEGMTSLENILSLTEIEYQTISYSILEGRDMIDGLKAATSVADTVNRFIIASESEAFVNDVFRNINLLARDNRKVEIFCHSKVRGYDIEVENLHNDDLHISLAYYIDYDNPEVIRFVKQYRALFKTEPTQFSFQGYDITSYFSRMCAEFGDNWVRAIGRRSEVMLQAKFDFRDGSRINEGVRRIEYEPDYRIKPVE